MYLLTGRGCVHKHLHCTHSNSSLAGDVYTNTDTVHTVTPHWMGDVYTNIYCTHRTSSQDGGCVHKLLLYTQYLWQGTCTQTSTVHTVPPHRMGDVYTNIYCTHSTSSQDGGCVHKHLLYTQYLLTGRGGVHKHLETLYAQSLLTGWGMCTQTSTVHTVPPHRMGDVYTNIYCTHSTSSVTGDVYTNIYWHCIHL